MMQAPEFVVQYFARGEWHDYTRWSERFKDHFQTDKLLSIAAKRSESGKARLIKRETAISELKVHSEGGTSERLA